MRAFQDAGLDAAVTLSLRLGSLPRIIISKVVLPITSEIYPIQSSTTDRRLGLEAFKNIQTG